MNEEFANQHVSLFPLPPWQLIDKYAEPNFSQGLSPAPPPPMKGVVYRMFGSCCNTDDPILKGLEYYNVKRVYPQVYNLKRELRKINFSLLANYLDLLDIITKDPLNPKRMEKTDDISILFINMHHLVNEYRPYQARDLLKEILKYQVQVSTETAKRAEEYLEKAKNVLKDAQKELGKDAENFTLNDLDPELKDFVNNLQTSEDVTSLLQSSSLNYDKSNVKSESIDINKEQVTELFDPILWKYIEADENSEMMQN